MNLIIYIVLFLNVVTSTLYQPLKVSLILLALVASIFQLKSNTLLRLTFAKTLILIIVLILLPSFTAALIGFLNNNPGVLPMMPAFLVWPLLFSFLVFNRSHSLPFLDKLRTVLEYSAVIIYIITIILFASSTLPALSDLKSALLGLGLRSTVFASESIEFSSPFVGSLIFLCPYFLACYVLQQTEQKKKSENKYLLQFLFSCVALFFSGKRGFIVSFVLQLPYLLYFISSCQGSASYYKKLRPILLVSMMLFALFAFLDASTVSTAIDYFVLGFDDSGSYSASFTRLKQFQELLNLSAEYPLFGAGLGAIIPSKIHAAQPWAVELQYLGLLFHTGLFGIICYLASFTLFFSKVFAVSRTNPLARTSLFPLSCGLLAIIIANSTNPYMFKFDAMWFVFLPFAFLNYFCTI